MTHATFDLAVTHNGSLVKTPAMTERVYIPCGGAMREANPIGAPRRRIAHGAKTSPIATCSPKSTSPSTCTVDYPR